MKITIEIPDVALAAKALNNATASFGETCWAAMFNMNLPKKLEPLASLDAEELKRRYMIVKDIAEQIEAVNSKEE